MRTRDPFEYICECDTAIDKEAEGFDFRRYRESGDRAFIPLKPGEKAQAFTLRPLSHRERLEMTSARMREFLPACYDFARFVIQPSEGFDFQPVATRSGREVVPEEKMDQLLTALEDEGIAPADFLFEITEAASNVPGFVKKS